MKPSKKLTNEPEKKAPFWDFVDNTTSRTAKVINSKKADKVLKESKPTLKQTEENRHAEALAGKANGSSGGLFDGLMGNGPTKQLLTNPYVIGAGVGVGLIIKLAQSLRLACRCEASD